MHFRTSLRFTGNAGALARNEREAQNYNLDTVLSYLEKTLRLPRIAGEGARVPSDYDLPTETRSIPT